MTELKKGYTLMHEHVTIDLSGVKGDPDCRLDCFEETVREFEQLYEYGVQHTGSYQHRDGEKCRLHPESRRGVRNSHDPVHRFL